MARRPVHMKKSVLSAQKRKALPASAFAVPSERKFPINDLYHGRLALIYVMSPSNAAYREEVVDAVLSRYPELRFFWESRSKNLAKRRRPAAAARIAANPSHSYEDAMPIYTLMNPLRYVDTPVIKVGRLVKSRSTGRTRIAGGSENHAMNPATGAAFCGAGLDRRGGMFGGSPRDGYIHPVKGDVVTCMRCIKLINMNAGEGIIERDLDAGARGKTAGHKNKMIRGGDQGQYVSANARFGGSKGSYKPAQSRLDAKGKPTRARSGVPDFAERAFYDDRPSQTFGPKRGRVMVDDEAILAADMSAPRRKRRKPAPVVQVAPAARVVGLAEEYMDNPRRRGSSEKPDAIFVLDRSEGAEVQVVYRTKTGARVAQDELRALSSWHLDADGVRSNLMELRDAKELAAEVADALGFPAKSIRVHRARAETRRAAGLAKGQSLMALAAQAYHAGEYDSMQEALSGVSRRARNNPRRNPQDVFGRGSANIPFAARFAGGGGGSDLSPGYTPLFLPRTPGEASRGPAPSSGGGGSQPGGTASTAPSGGSTPAPAPKANPRRKGAKRRGGKRTAAQSNAARAMNLFHSGRARSLAEAWEMIRRGR